MIETVAAVALLVVAAVIAFAASIRLGMLLGMRLDRVLEARALAGTGESEPEQPGSIHVDGREEDRGE
jgi:hypothetical protein